MTNEQTLEKLKIILTIITVDELENMGIERALELYEETVRTMNEWMN